MEKPVFNDNGKWSKGNVYLSMALSSKYRLSGNHLAVLLYIISEYNRKVFSYKTEAETGVSVSYDDLQCYLNSSEKTPKNVIKALLEWKLINCENLKQRDGKAKYQYKPNVKLLNKILNDYLEDFPELKNTVEG